jgi:hypothetical protein
MSSNLNDPGKIAYDQGLLLAAKPHRLDALVLSIVIGFLLALAVIDIKNNVKLFDVFFLDGY